MCTYSYMYVWREDICSCVFHYVTIFSSQQFLVILLPFFAHFLCQQKLGWGGERTSRIKKEQMTKDLMIMTLVNRTFGEIGVSNKDKGNSET